MPSFLLAIDSFIAKPGGDSIFMYVAQGILEGEVPYLDRWDHKGPLLYLINAVGLLCGAFGSYRHSSCLELSISPSYC